MEKTKKNHQNFALPGDFYVVEKILAKRIVRGRTEYLLKWLGSPSSSNTWEPIQNFASESMVAKFEREQRLTVKKLSTLGFARGLKPERIVNSSKVFGHTFYIIQWENTNIKDCVLEEVIARNAPQLLKDYLK